MLKQLVSKDEQCGNLSDINGNPISGLFQYIFQTRPEQLERTSHEKVDSDSSTGNLFNSDPSKIITNVDIDSKPLKTKAETSNNANPSFFNWMIPQSWNARKTYELNINEKTINRALKNFFQCAKHGIKFNSQEKYTIIIIERQQQQEFRNRITVLARQLYTDQGFNYADEQVEMLLKSLGMENTFMDVSLYEDKKNHLNQCYNMNYNSSINFTVRTPYENIGYIFKQHEIGIELDKILNSEEKKEISVYNSDINKNQAAMYHFNQQNWKYQIPDVSMAYYQNVNLVNENKMKQQALSQDIESTNQSTMAFFNKVFSNDNKFDVINQENGYLQKNNESSIEGVNPNYDSHEIEETDDGFQQIGQEIFEKMLNDKNPKFRNSKFLLFVKKISEGKFIIRNEQLIEVENDNEASLENIDINENIKNSIEEMFSNEAFFKDIFSEQELTDNPIELENEEDKLNEILLHHDAASDIIEEYVGFEGGWVSPSIEGNEMSENQFTHIFQSNNIFKDETDLLNKAKDYYKEGNYENAIMASEEAIKQENNSEAWKILGLSLSECDEDLKAITAFKKGLEADKTNISILVPLAAAEANEIHEQDAMSDLMNWMRQHPVHNKILLETPRPPDPSQQLRYMIEVFERAMRENKDDIDLCIATGILNHMCRDFEKARNYFKLAHEWSPNDHTVLNKIGASLANDGKYNEALENYEKALKLKEKYVRGLINMGISLENIDQNEKALDAYMDALEIYPKNETLISRIKTLSIILDHKDLLNHFSLDSVENDNFAKNLLNQYRKI